MKPGTAPATAADWIAELANGELTGARRAALADWLRESPTHVRGLVEHALIDQDLRGLSIPREQLESWTHEAKLAARETVPLFPASAPVDPVLRAAKDVAGPRRRMRLPLALAAGIVLALGVAWSVFWWQKDRYATGLGEQRILTLSDGSVVTLNTESALEVRYSGALRTIELVRGEAFFRVAPEGSRPFEVIAPDATVKALGTEFNIRLARRAIVVSVLDGRVAVSPAKSSLDAREEADIPDNGTGRRDRTVAELSRQGPDRERINGQVILSAGEQVRLERASLADGYQSVRSTSSSAAALQAVAWMRGRLEFDKAPLAEVIREFERYRKLDVRIEDPTLNDMRLTGSFDAHDPQSALDYIATIPGIEVRKAADGVVIQRK